MIVRAHISFFLALMTLLFANSAAGSPVVYPGCYAPPSTTGNVHYVDPVHGSPLGNGSQQQPWRTLSEVIAAGLFSTMPTHYDNTLKMWIYANPNAPIKPGDTVYLMSGDHGSVVLQGDYPNGVAGYINSRFITIAAYPGQTPIVEKLSIIGGAKWVFQGITFQSTNNTGTYMTASNNVPDYWLVWLSGNHSQIVLRNNILQSQSDTSAWKIMDWEQKRASGIVDIKGKCISFTGNTIRNIGTGIATQQSGGVLIYGNTIDRFSDDGIEYGSNAMLIQGNRITNSIEDGDGMHRDGMQGQPDHETTLLQNVMIEDNVVIRLTDPTLPYPAALQGIDEFDGYWKNLVVTGNVVITDGSQGIAFYGIHYATISNNILLGDSGKVLPCYLIVGANPTLCAQESVVYDTSATPNLRVETSKLHIASSAVTVSNNMASGLGIDPMTSPVSVVGNTCISKNGKCQMGYSVSGRLEWYGNPGTYPGNNVITSVGAASLFVSYDPTDMIYNLNLRSGVVL